MHYTDSLYSQIINQDEGLRYQGTVEIVGDKKKIILPNFERIPDKKKFQQIVNHFEGQVKEVTTSVT